MRPIPVSLPQVKLAEGVGSFLELGTRYVANCVGDVKLHARLPYVSGISLEDGILAPAGLKDADRSLVVAEQVDELVHELSPQLYSQCSIESLDMAGEGVVLEYPRW